MNYYILGIAIILIILMMGTKKREGYTQNGYRFITSGTTNCPAGERIETGAECEKARVALKKRKGTPTAETGGYDYGNTYPKGCFGEVPDADRRGAPGPGYVWFNKTNRSWDLPFVNHSPPQDFWPICKGSRNTDGELITTPASSWDQAEAYCKQQGRNLVSIHSDAENDKVIKYMKENTTSSYPWLGGKTTSGNKSKNLNDYKWTDGTQFDYKASTWHTNDNAPTHVHMYRDGAWGTWTGTSQGICGPKGGWKKPEKGCKSMDGRYSMGDGRRYTGGWALSNGEGDRTKCKALCESQPECKITGQYCNSTAYPSDNRCYCQFGDGCKKDDEGEVKCRFTIDNVVDEVKYNGKKIDFTGDKNNWTVAKEFSFTPVPGGVLEIKGHEWDGVAGCKNSGLLLECESSKHPKWNHWGSNEKDWTTGDGRPVCISTSGFYLEGAKGFGKKIWDSNNNVENKWGAVTLVGSPDGGVDWVKCADEGGKCKCSGKVRYGKDKTWGKILDVQGEISCNNGQQWGDPLFGTRKECQCNSVGLETGMPPPESGKVTNPPCVRYNWGDWSPCNRMCAGGTQTRIRANNGFCIENGKVIYFDSEKRECNTQQCPKGPTGQQGERGLRGPKGPVGRKGPPGKSGGGTGFPGSSGLVGGTGIKGKTGLTGPRGETGFRGEEGKVMSKAQVNNDLLSGIYEQIIRFGGVDNEDGDNTTVEEFSALKPFNNSNYN